VPRKVSFIGRDESFRDVARSSESMPVKSGSVH
jgi:hypothetical protein